MSESRFPHPPDGLVLCGGEGWERMSEDAREELWLLDTYLRDGGKRVHGNFASYRDAHTQPQKLPNNSTEKA